MSVDNGKPLGRVPGQREVGMFVCAYVVRRVVNIAMAEVISWRQM